MSRSYQSGDFHQNLLGNSSQGDPCWQTVVNRALVRLCIPRKQNEGFILNSVAAHDIQHYLNEQGYVRLDELALRSDTTPEQIRAFEAAQCIPATSYLAGGDMTFTSSFGTYRVPIEPERFYHPSIHNWVVRALSLSSSRSLDEVAKIVRADFDNAFESILKGEAPPWPQGVDYAWSFITDGTWGLCLKDITVENLLTKECARATIRGIVRPDPDHRLTQYERKQLEAAIAAFEAVALPFAPHEIVDSCRYSEIRPAIEKYNIKLAGLTS